MRSVWQHAVPAALAALLVAAPRHAARAQAARADTTAGTAADSTAGAADAPPTGKLRPRWQLFSELQYDANRRRDDSPLNPNNVAGLPAGETEWRLFPVVETEAGRWRARADLRASVRRVGVDPVGAAVEAQELVVGVALSDALYLAAGRQRL